MRTIHSLKIFDNIKKVLQKPQEVVEGFEQFINNNDELVNSYVEQYANDFLKEDSNIAAFWEQVERILRNKTIAGQFASTVNDKEALTNYLKTKLLPNYLGWSIRPLKVTEKLFAEYCNMSKFISSQILKKFPDFERSIWDLNQKVIGGKIKQVLIKKFLKQLSSIQKEIKTIIKEQYPNETSIPNNLLKMEVGDTITSSLKFWESAKTRDGCFVILNDKYQCGTDTHSKIVTELYKNKEVPQAEAKEIETYGLKSLTENRDLGAFQDGSKPMSIMTDEKASEGHFIKLVYGYVYDFAGKYIAIIDGRATKNYYINDVINILKKSDFNGSKFHAIMVVDEANKKTLTRVAKKRLLPTYHKIKLLYCR